jgi:hypothetical protein
VEKHQVLDMSGLLGLRPKSPLSVASAIGSVFIPSSLIIYLARPALFHDLDFPKLLLLSAAIGLPVLILWFFCFLIPNYLHQVRGEIRVPAAPIDKVKVQEIGEDLEWPAFMAAGLTANLTLYAVAVVASFRPISIRSTMLLVAAILGGVFALTALVSFIQVIRTRASELIAADEVELRAGASRILGWFLLPRRK